jgi:glycosyltransferase involved in cell wall biosynthesis
LISTAAGADLGIVLFEPTSLNYTYALPNKFFEYIMAGIPVLASNIETFEEYINQYKVGMTVDPSNVMAIAQTIKIMLSDEIKLKKWRDNARKASDVLNWENESAKLKKIYEKIRN